VPADQESLTADIERSRAQLAGSVAELIGRADVKARARASVTDFQHRAADTTARLRQDGNELARRNLPQLAAAAAALLAVAALVVWRAAGSRRHRPRG